jgi:exopolyphosphatase / guanosine-5'-triphosphate,3'-diphosphate pyrophosphatase
VAVEPAEGATSVRLECWGAGRKRALLEETLGKRVEILGPDGDVVDIDDGDGEGD